MKVLTHEQLAEFLPVLEKDFPRSLPVYHVMRNVVRQRFAWPGIEFIVDDFPNPSVCIARPRKDDKSFVPLMNGYQVFVYSKDTNVFRKMLFEEPDTLDWTQNIMFADLSEPEHLVLLEGGKGFRGGTFDHLITMEGFPTGEYCYYFDLPNLDLQYEVPEGLRLGTLNPEHAVQVARERNYGHTANNIAFFRYMMENEYPSAALFPVGSDSPIAYAIYKTEGVVGAAFIHPDYRKRGLYQVVLRALLKKLRDIGEIHVWVETMKFNLASQAGIKAVGAKEYEGHTVHWINYWPAGHAFDRDPYKNFR
ncbi:uncharacterized protein LOC129596622 [Paramacrobiotus metropolitanus]|uniref:uncharacterized protein LOC129596622 n=1 Tax=Paramacrobiotus metropolitanus TaxID=2943436 RepID=UPI0024465D5D|nr:uncharacterized protein LOC129596622 [Paramacrobiotus metropolitanus]